MRAFISLLAVFSISAFAEVELPKGKWVPISDGVLAQLAKDGKKPAWPGMSAGIAVDRTNGNVFMAISGMGLWRSADLGKTFERIDGGKIGGRCETSFALDLDPNGKRMACFMLDGPGAMTLDDGKTWKNCKDNSRGFDNAAVDWSPENPKTILAVRHESGGLLLLSQDAGKTYKELGKGFSAVGVFDEKTFVVTRALDGHDPQREGLKGLAPGILRTADGGATWTKVSELTPSGLVMRNFKGAGYWTSPDGVLVSRDKGQTWDVLGTPIAAGAGPYFGSDEKHILVATKDGLTITINGGKKWIRIAPFPPEYKFSSTGWFENYGWDKEGSLYASRMGKPAWKWEWEKDENGKLIFGDNGRPKRPTERDYPDAILD